MATHDYVLENQSGADFRQDLNNALQAIVSNNSNATEPSTTYAYQIWIDTANSLLKIRNSSNNAWITLPISISTNNTVDINGGTVNGITNFSFSTGQAVTTVLDEDNLNSDSNTALATQQSIKAYVDAQVTVQDLDISDGSNTIAIDLDSETLSLLGGTGISSNATANSVTFSIGQSVGTSDNVVFNQVTSALVGNASTATALQTARTINNTSFDGSANISFDTDEVTEGTNNLYYTDARFDTRLATKTTSNLTEGSNLYYTDARFDTRLGTKDTGDLTEGTNLYYTDARFDARFDTRLGTKDTGDLTEGTNLYYTDARFDTRLSAKDTGDLSEGTNLYYTNARADARVNLQTGTNLDLSNKSTSDLSEGTNLYYTAARFNTAFSSKSTSDLSEGTNLYYTDARFDTRLSAKDTDDLSEGTTNLYYTDTRSNSAIDARVTQSFVNALNPNAASIDDNSVALGVKTTGNYVQDITGTANEVDVTGSGSETASVIIGLPNDVIIAGNLTVNGTTVTVNTETLSVEDPLIKLAKNNNATDSVDIGFYGLYDTSGSQDLYAGLFRDANDSGKFKLFKDLQVEPTTTVNTSGTGYAAAILVASLEGNVTGNVTGTVSSISNHSTSNLSEGTNLYYTDARFDTRLASKDTGDLTEGSNLYYTDARFDTRLASKDTANLTEGSNLYFTNARADARVNLQTGSNLDLSNKSTSDLSEGTNLYYTDARFDTRLGTKDTGDLTEGTNLYYTDARFDARFDTRLATKDTDNLSEGSSNLYYTDTRANTAIDARVTNTFINNLSGVVADTSTALATARTINGVSFDGTADITTLSAGTGVSVSGTAVSIGQAVATSDSPTFANMTLSGTDSIKVPSGTTAQRNGSAVNGMFRYNSTSNKFEGYQDGAWNDISIGTIPTNNNQLTNGASYITASDIPTIPTNNNQLTNGAGYTTYTSNQATDSTSGVSFSGVTINGSNDLTLNTGNWTGDKSGKIQRHSTHMYLQTDNAGRFIFRNSNGGEGLYIEASSGALVSSNNITAYSDIRLKKDVKTIKNALDKVCAMRGVEYTRKSNDEREIGVIAQEVKDVVPELVKIQENTDSFNEGISDIHTMKYQNTVGLLIEAIKELQAKVKDLESK